MGSAVLTCEILLAPGFVASELALVVDVLRIANRIAGTEVARWTFVGFGQTGLTEGMGGLAVPCERLSYTTPVGRLLVVPGGQNIASNMAATLARMARYQLCGARVLLLSDAAAHWSLRVDPDRLGHDRRATTHWENLQNLRHEGHDLRLEDALFVQEGRLTTCAGMCSAADALLDLLSQFHDLQLARSVSRALVMDGIRPSGTRQKSSICDSPGLYDPHVSQVVLLMQSNIETPLSMPEISGRIGISVRQIERLFRKCLGQSPVAYYRRIRLDRGRYQLVHSRMSITEIAVSCGFSTVSAFSKCYTGLFGQSPRQHRHMLEDNHRSAQISSA